MNTDPGDMSEADKGQMDAVDAATSGSNAGSIGGGGNFGSNVTGTLDPGQMQDQGFDQGYEFAAQDAFNEVHGITDKNPYGRMGFFSRVFGLDPKNIDYTGIMGLGQRRSIANNQFSKFANPQNIAGQLGYNKDFPTAPPGQLRAGVQSKGYMTQYGPVMEQARKQGVGEMVARGSFGLFGGLPGLALGQIGTKEYGLPGQPGFENFDPENPQTGGGIFGSTALGGLNLGQVKDAFVGAFTPTNLPDVAPTVAPTVAPVNLPPSNTPVPVKGNLRPDDLVSFLPTIDNNQVATVDFTNLKDVGDGLFRTDSDPSVFDNILEGLGIREKKSRPSGQIKSSTVESEPLFDLDRINIFGN